MRKKKKTNGKPNRLKKSVYPLSLALVTATCVYVLLPGFKELEGVRAQIADLRRVAREKSLGNESLKKEIESMDTPEGVERAARQHLRLAGPGELLIVFETPENAVSAE
jgi:cell division protein FtsB